MVKPSKPRRGQAISARHIARVVDEATRSRKISVGEGVRLINRADGIHIGLEQDVLQPEWWIGKVVTQGPSGEADYTDERYWVRQVYCQTAAGDGESRITFDTSGHSAAYYVTATNLAEINLLPGFQHRLMTSYANTPLVVVYALWDNANPPYRHWYFYSSQGCRDVQLADGICMIRNLNPNTNYSTSGWYSSQRYPTNPGGDLEERILIHFPNMVPDARELVTSGYFWVEGPDVGDSYARFRVYRIVENFNPCTVTWNTRPNSTLAGGDLMIRAITDNNDPGNEISADAAYRPTWSLGGDWGGAYGIEIRTTLWDGATRALVMVSNHSPIVVADVRERLHCPGETTPAISTTTPAGVSSTPTTTTVTTSTAPPTTTGTGTTSTPGPTTTTVPTTSTIANPCVCCPGDTPDQMDVTISGLGGNWCEGQDNGTWRLNLVVANDTLCAWSYNVGRTITLECHYNDTTKEYVWEVGYGRDNCTCSWQAGFATHHCDGGSIGTPYAGSCLDNGGGTASWTPVT